MTELEIDTPLVTQRRWKISARTYYRRVEAGLLPAPTCGTGYKKGIPSHENDLMLAAVKAGAGESDLRRLVSALHARRAELAASSI